MVEDDDYCIDVIYQSRAVENAIKEVDGIILENHLNTCASKAIKQGKGKQAIAEIMSVFKNDK
jgi:DNA-binding FrmR family transcriptional regulator